VADTPEAALAMRVAIERCDLYAAVARPVLFVGPIGAGKTTLARRLHSSSGRTGRFVAVTSGEASESMYRDTLFGHRRGAFTGASADRAGAIERALEGTLLLDDIAFLPHEAQIALLRVLEERRFYPIGAERQREVRCRFAFASTVSLTSLIDDGHLIPDLSSRLGEFVVRVPGLAERRTEIPVIARRFAAEFRVEHGEEPHVDFSDDALKLLQAYCWPTNVRGLKNVVERAVVHAGLREPIPVVDAIHLPDRIVSFEPTQEESAKLTRALVARALADAAGNQTEAARRLGVHRNTVARWARRLK